MNGMEEVTVDMSVFDQLEASIDTVCERFDDAAAWRAVLRPLADACGQQALRYEVWRDGDGPIHGIGLDDDADETLEDAQVLVAAHGLTAQLIHSRALLRQAGPEQRAVWSLAGSRLALAARAHLQGLTAHASAAEVAQDEVPFLVVARGGVVRINAAMRAWIATHPAYLRLIGRQLEDPRRALDRLAGGLAEAAHVALPVGIDPHPFSDQSLLSTLVALRWPAPHGSDALLVLLSQQGLVRTQPAALDPGVPLDAAARDLVAAIAAGSGVDALIERHGVVRIAARAPLRSTVPVRAPADLPDAVTGAANASVLGFGLVEGVRAWGA